MVNSKSGRLDSCTDLDKIEDQDKQKPSETRLTCQVDL